MEAFIDGHFYRINYISPLSVSINNSDGSYMWTPIEITLSSRPHFSKDIDSIKINGYQPNADAKIVFENLTIDKNTIFLKQIKYCSLIKKKIIS